MSFPDAWAAYYAILVFLHFNKSRWSRTNPSTCIAPGIWYFYTILNLKVGSEILHFIHFQMCKISLHFLSYRHWDYIPRDIWVLSVSFQKHHFVLLLDSEISLSNSGVLFLLSLRKFVFTYIYIYIYIYINFLFSTSLRTKWSNSFQWVG